MTSGFLSCYSIKDGNGGNLSVNAKQNIFIGGAISASFGTAKSGNIALVSSKGNINIKQPIVLSNGALEGGFIQTYGSEAGSVNIEAYGDIIVNQIYAIGFNLGGTVTLTSKAGKIDTNNGRIRTDSPDGNGGRVTLKALSDISSGAVSSQSINKDSGSIEVTSTEGKIDFGQNYLISSSNQGKGGDITLTAKSTKNKASITTGEIYSSSFVNGDGGNVKLTASGDILTASVNSYSLISNGKGGDITLVSTGGYVKTINDSQDPINTPDFSIKANSNGGNAGTVTLTAYSEVVTKKINTNTSEGGIGGTVTLTSKTGNIETSGINTTAKDGNAGRVTLNAYVDVLADEINANSSGIGAGGTVKLTSKTGSIDTNGKIINTSAQDSDAGQVILNAFGEINGGEINATSNSKDAGIIEVTTTEGNIDFGQNAISAYSGTGKGANITLTAKSLVNNRSITTGGVSAVTSTGGDGGTVRLTASGDISTSYISTFSDKGKGGDVIVVTPNGKINTRNTPSDGAINTIGSNGNAGSVTLNASGDLDIDLIYASSNNNGTGGTVELTSKSGNIDTNGKPIFSSAVNGNAGKIILNAKNEINVGDVNAYTSVGDGGEVRLTTNQNISTKNISANSFNTGNAGIIILNAKNEINVGEVNAYTTVGNGAEVRLTANQNISSKNIFTSSRNGSGNNITLTSVNGGINTNGGLISTTSITGGNAGKVTLNAALNIQVGDIFARSRAEDGGVFNGGAVTVDAATGRVDTGNITSTSLTGVSGKIKVTAQGDSITLNISDGTISTKNITSNSQNGNGGQIILNAKKNINSGEVNSSSQNGNSNSISYVQDKKLIAVENLSAWSLKSKKIHLRKSRPKRKILLAGRPCFLILMG